MGPCTYNMAKLLRNCMQHPNVVVRIAAILWVVLSSEKVRDKTEVVFMGQSDKEKRVHEEENIQ